MNFYFFALASLGDGISGGDRIYIELARRWSKRFPVTLFVWEEGKAMCERQNLTGKYLAMRMVRVGALSRLGFVFTYFYRVILGIKLGLTLSLPQEKTYLYSASEFWMDALPAFFLKLRYGKKATWVAAWYQTAPSPFRGFAEGERSARYRFRAFAYWFMQLPIKPLIAKYADKILINNVDERKQFPLRAKNDLVVLIGAVDIERIHQWQKKNTSLKKKYDAVFQGRFHPQKGVVELLDIWKKVIQKMPNAKLAMIGDGPLMENVKSQIANDTLEKNIELFGYVYDGSKKYTLFSQSELVVHPAFYDSGGMASAEAMAFGLPCVGFDLISYESYYPKGMVKVKTGDVDAFADAILDLHKNEKKRKRIGKEAKNMIEDYWSWDKRAMQILEKVQSL
jgi:glycosyltransferase involved in cell wall biosynthesis